jgi:predicted DNA-binding antitoxin AbrB/MazE fold protein
MTANLKAIYGQGILRLKEPLSLPDGAQVDVTVVSHEEDDGERAQGMKDCSWDAIAQLLAECAIDTGVPDLASQHDHYLFGSPKRPTDPEVSG